MTLEDTSTSVFYQVPTEGMVSSRYDDDTYPTAAVSYSFLAFKTQELDVKATEVSPLTIGCLAMTPDGRASWAEKASTYMNSPVLRVELNLKGPTH